MAINIKSKRGLKLRLKGEAEKKTSPALKSKTYALIPDNFHGLVPKMLIKKEGTAVKAGEPLFYSKYNDQTKVVSPVSGKLKTIERGARRRILRVIIEADDEFDYVEHDILDPLKTDAKKLKAHIFESGCGIFFKQRPYDIPVSAEDVPKSIHISTYNTTPLGADFEYILSNKKEEFQNGINALTKLTEGKVFLGVDRNAQSFLHDTENVKLVKVSGPHPAGNVGFQIQKTNPINKGEKVWTIRPEDVAIIGELLSTGKFNAERTVAVCGSDAVDKQYFKTLIGAEVNSIIEEVNTSKTRIISGDVFTGDIAQNGDHINFFSNEITLIPEGNQYRMFGWLPFKDNNIPSVHNTSFAKLRRKPFQVNTSLNGEERALVVTGEMEEVMPMDILPMQLLKACMTGDIDKMENLGIYEVSPEDFATVEYVNTSKIEAQEVIRQGLDLMITEVG
ncbi:Na(+)-translocating NADH-quinone reductase subunit A [Mesohalobacter halotolerans]|uniref:Na(+)-translocating NADH-quinone reductase subunit A n=1 Tax=Mesohalobacter halotolerans TaxID=1883405 RepID=A0A4U5TPG0_9FLAO|nr:Na(+)-translocating NADH-quinone reductase subunit A [Mesohalobacter halotolerans]MBS3738996.1 Na(+)-translocating NADH-quinone reductase subunit A [Psychroflexus sp.]TKS55752.1 Na(+)-translocating NADH-quinone reductase subunit A [Mesohalobacter halotolerans]